MNTVRINGQDYTSSLSDAEIAFMGNLSLPTTAQTLSGAIAEHETDISQLNSNMAMVRVPFETDGVAIYKCGRVVTLTINNLAYVTASANTTFLTLPSEAWPIYQQQIANAYNTTQRIIIASDGSLYCPTALSNAFIRFSITYLSLN